VLSPFVDELCLALSMRLNQPEVLVNAARNLGENVSRVGVSEFRRLINRLTREPAKIREDVRECLNVSQPIANLQRILGEPRPACRNAHRSFGDAAQLRDPFRYQVNVLVRAVNHFVKEFMERYEIRPLYVPVGLLGLHPQINAVSQPVAEKLHGFRSLCLS
jgi:hypothetical protein